MMNSESTCSCGQWQAKITVTKPLKELNPRICDCDYCQSHPSSVVSDPNMVIDLIGGTTQIRKNGDRLANFYHCDCCGDFLAVGCHINGVLHGAVNSNLFSDTSQLGESVNIQPRLLSANEKIERWAGLWGTLNGV